MPQYYCAPRNDGIGAAGAPALQSGSSTMRRLRTNKSLVLFSVAVVVIAGLFPVVAAALPSVILTPLWLIVPAVSLVVVRRLAARCDEQPVALLSLALFRAPPAALALA
jgi:hypothetical protein